MSDKTKNVPKIRFPEFTDEWEVRKLSELLSPTTEKNNAGKYTQDDILAASLGNELEKKHIFFGLRSTEASVKSYRVVKSGDVIYTKSPIKGYPNGIVRTNKGEDGIVPSLYCVYHSTLDINSSIIQSYFEDKNRLNMYLYPLVNVGARNNVNITDSGFLEGTICLSKNIEEQNKIDVFLTDLMELINLHQRKLKNLQEKKKSLLQNMFPKNGETVPEIRFPGFTDAWEQRKLRELAEFRKGKGFSKGDLLPEGEPIILYGRLYTNYQTIIKTVDTFAKPKGNDILSVGNEVIVPSSGETAEDIARASVVSSKGILLGGDLNIIKVKGNLHPPFIALFLSNGRGKKELIKKSQGTSVVHLYNSDLKKANILYPNLEEQQEIGLLFSKIEDLITLHQRKLDHLQEQKKSLLQQMFV